MAEGPMIEVSDIPVETVPPPTVEVPTAPEKENLVREIGAFYNVKEKAVKKGLVSQVSVLPQEEFNRQVEEYLREVLSGKGVNVESKLLDKDNELDTMFSEALGTSVDEVNARMTARNMRNVDILKSTVEREGGIAIPIDEEKSRILIKEGTGLDERMVQIHESIHSMASRGPKNGGGFRDSNGGERNLDEAATQVLTLGILYPDITPKDMYDKIRSGEIKTPYGTQVTRLLIALHATSQDPKPITIKDLAQYYFDDEADIQAVFLKMNIIYKAPENIKGAVKRLFANDMRE